MTKSAPQIHDLARQILAREGELQTSPDGPVPTALRALDKLRLHLIIFVGAAGYQALLTRAMALARADDSRPGQFRILADGKFDVEVNVDDRDTVIGITNLLAHILGLTNTLVGETLVLRLVQDMWPTVTLDLSLKPQTAIREVTP